MGEDWFDYCKPSIGRKANHRILLLENFLIFLPVFCVRRILQCFQFQLLCEIIKIFYSVFVELLDLKSIFRLEVLILWHVFGVETEAKVMDQVPSRLESIDVCYNTPRLCVEMTDEVYLLTWLDLLHAFHDCLVVKIRTVLQDQDELGDYSKEQDDHIVVEVSLGMVFEVADDWQYH